MIQFRFIEIENASSLFINEAFMQVEKSKVIIDFFPVLEGRDVFEDVNSDFSIHFKEMEYEIISGNVR